MLNHEFTTVISPHDGIKKLGKDNRPAMRKTISLIIIGICLLAAGCAPSTVWNVEVLSPDGHYTAIARTLQNAGPGTASLDTVVFLKQTISSNPPTEVLDFSCEGPVPRPFVLDNIANAGGTINLKMKWLNPTHLEVTYSRDDATLNFQAIKYQGISISAQDLSVGGPGEEHK